MLTQKVRSVCLSLKGYKLSSAFGNQKLFRGHSHSLLVQKRKTLLKLIKGWMSTLVTLICLAKLMLLHLIQLRLVQMKTMKVPVTGSSINSSPNGLETTTEESEAVFNSVGGLVGT